MSIIKKIVKKIALLKGIYRLYSSISPFFRCRPLKIIKMMSWYFKDYFKFKTMARNYNLKQLYFKDIYPCLTDNTEYTPIDPVYFFQDSWAAKKIFELKPDHHYDIGSSVKTIGIISQFVPVTMIDIRPLELELENLFFLKGSILNIPFESNSIKTLSCLCVAEHIGLGRYGDSIDPLGSEKAIKELKRVLKTEGIILFSIPVDSENKIYFNAHRAFTREYILELFDGFCLIEEKYIYGNKIYCSYDKNKGFGTGLFMFKKGGNKNVY